MGDAADVADDGRFLEVLPLTTGESVVDCVSC